MHHCYYCPASLKRAGFSLVFFLYFLVSFAQPRNKRIVLSKNGDNGFLFMANSKYDPGDTLVIRAALNPWSYLYIGGVKGTPDKPLVIINEGVVELSAGIDIENCEYIKLTGSGSKDRYGFRVQHASSVALNIHGKSSHVEAERIYAEDCSFGCWIKNEANCDTTINSWVLDHISVHDYEFRNMKIEGFYMGSTDGDNASRPITCNGAQQFYKPSELGNIRIYNGVIDGTGRPAIMLSNARVGTSEIFNNTVSNVGREYNDQQGTGISLGLYTRAYVHDNTVRNTLTWGIACLGGSGLVRIEHNHVENSGSLDGHTLNWPQNIVVDTRKTNPVDSTQFIILNNTVSNPGKDVKNIEVWRSEATYRSDNLICGNTDGGKPATVKVADGVRWRNCGVWQSSSGAHLSPFVIGGVAGVAALIVVGLMAMRRRQ